MIDLFTKIAERIRLSAAELKFRFRELIGRLTGRSARANDYGKGIFYIRGSDVLPPPLSPEEERKLTQRLTEQDSEARSTLIGTIGLIKAVNTFDPSKNIKLATYASRCIENEILMYLRRTGKTKSEISFDEPLNVDWDGNELLLSDILGTEEDVIFGGIEEEVNRDLLNSALRKLDQREKRIVEMRFGLISGCEMTQKEVADYMGISQSYISRLEKKIISRLRREIKKMG